MCVVDEVQQRRGDRPFELQPAVQRLFDGPGDFAEPGQADHAPAALEGVEAAPQREQRLRVGRRGAQQLELLALGGQHLLRLFDEDLEQVGLDRGRCRRARRCRQGGGGFGCAWRRRRRQVRGRADFGRADFGRRQVEGFEGRRERGRLVVHIFSRFFGCLFGHIVAHLERRGGGEGVGRGRSGGCGWHGGLGRAVPVTCVRGVAALSEMLREQGVEAGAAVRQGVEIEAERGELVRERFEVGLAGLAVRVREPRDAHRGLAHELERPGLAQHAERTDDVLQRFVQAGERVAPGLVAEEVVQHLLDLGEAGAHLAHELFDGGFFLRLAADAQAGFVLRPAEGFAAHERFEAPGQGLDARAEIGFGGARAECAFERQQRRGDLHGCGLGALQRVLAQPVREGLERVDERLRLRTTERRRRRSHGDERFLEALQFDRGPGAERIPVRARCGELAVERLEQRRRGRAADRGVGCGQERVELIERAHRLLVRGACRAVGDLVEQLALQAFGGVGGAAEQAAELGVDLRAQALDRREGLQAAVDERIVEGEAGPPQAARRGVGLQAVDLGDGLAHHARAVACAALAQPLEQAALEAAARAALCLVDVLGGPGLACGGWGPA